jgi:hypothetical protein
MKLPDRVLEPVERLSEILFGLIMALTITGAVSVATADHIQIRTMLFAALGCNLPWGIIDGGMYLMARLGERGRNPLDVLGFDRTSAMNARSLPNVTKTSVQMRSRLCPQALRRGKPIPQLLICLWPTTLGSLKKI